MAKQLSKQVSRLPQVLEDMPDQPDQRIGKVAYAQSLTDVWILLCRMAGLGLIGSLFVKGHSMDRRLYTRQPFQNIPEPSHEDILRDQRTT